MAWRLLAVGAAFAAWELGRRRWGGRAPAAWTAVFAALCGAAGALVLAPVYLAVPVPGWPTPGEWALTAAAAGFGLLWARLGPSTDQAARLDDAATWAPALGRGAVAAGLIMMFLVRAFSIPSQSMEDTLKVGDRVLVDEAAYGLRLPGGRRLASRPPRRGDLLVFRFPSEDPAELHCTGPQYGKDFLKRVVGVPGDVVEVRDGQLLVDGKAPAEPYVKRTAVAPCARPPVTPSRAEYQRLWLARRLDREVGEGIRDHFGPVTVPPGDSFVLGDNRDGSCDSRFWGPVPDRFVKGRAVAVYWPPTRVGFVR